MSKSNAQHRVHHTLHDPAPFSAAHIPSLTTTLQNLLISFGTLLSSIFSLWITFVVLLPLSCLKAITPNVLWARFARKAIGAGHTQSETSGKRKIVLVLDGSQGLGFGLVAKYATEPNAVVVAATNDIETLRNAILDPSAPQSVDTIVQCTNLDLTAPRKTIMEALKKIDKDYGPISHFYVVPPAGGQVNSTENASVKQNGALVNGANGFATKESHSGRQSVQTTDDFLSTHIVAVVTCVLSMLDIMKGRGYGTITIAIPVSGAYPWSWPSLFSSSSDHHGMLNQITASSTSVFLRTFASSLHFMASRWGVDIVPVAFDLSLTEHERLFMRSLGKNEQEGYLNKWTKDLAAKVACRSDLHSPTSAYYHDHEYVATLGTASGSRGIITQMVRGVKFNPVIEGIVARSINWYKNLNTKAISKKVNSKVKDAVRNAERVGKMEAKELKEKVRDQIN